MEAWARNCLTLPDDAAVLVSELECVVPGCPPLETVVAFWTENGDRGHFKIFKAVEEVMVRDMPPVWLKDSLFVFEGADFECC